jgi:hypothetical protein
MRVAGNPSGILEAMPDEIRRKLPDEVVRGACDRARRDPRVLRERARGRVHDPIEELSLNFSMCRELEL